MFISIIHIREYSTLVESTLRSIVLVKAFSLPITL